MGLCQLDFRSLLKPTLVLLILLPILLSACSTSVNLSNRSVSQSTASVNSLTIVPNQLPAPAFIKSIQLYANDNIESAPIIKLNSDDKLTLSFDELTDVNGQFRITFTHHGKTWGSSEIPQSWFLEGSGELILGGGTKDNSQGPEYIHYQTTISLKELNFLTSGNYLLHVSDASTGKELFSLPFFIVEGEGELSSTSQTLFNSGNNFYPVHRLFSTFSLPDFVAYPEFDLSFSFVQNRFWSKTRFTESYDLNTPGLAKFDLPQSNAFPANVDHITKNLSDFSQSTYSVIEWNPGSNPPEVILREDILNFLSSGNRSNSDIIQSKPEPSTRSTYARTIFRLEGDEGLTPDDEIHLLGDFNQWTVSDDSRMSPDPDTGLWTNTQLLKEGTYSYKYVKAGINSEIELTSLANNSSPSIQEYISFVYFNDPERKYDRLLAVEVFFAR